MEDTQQPVSVEENAIRYVFQTTWDRLKKVLLLLTLTHAVSIVHRQLT